MKHPLALLSAVALVAVGLFPVTASAEFIYRGPQHQPHHRRYWVEVRTRHDHHGHTVVVPAHWVWLP